MKQYLQQAVATLVVTLGLVSFAAAPASAINVFDACNGNNQTEVCKAKDETVQSPVRTVISTLLFVVGILSVIMIIVGGIRYVISNGDSSQITAAKNTIQYAVIGLVVSMLAYAIVNFVVAQF